MKESFSKGSGADILWFKPATNITCGELYAGLVFSGFLSNPDHNDDVNLLARLSVAYAKKLVKALES